MELFILAVFVLLLTIVLIIFKKRDHKISKNELENSIKKLNQLKHHETQLTLIKAHKIFISSIKLCPKDKDLTAAQITAKYQERFPNQKKIWRLHKLRNQVAHEVDFKLNTNSEEIINTYKKALKGLS